MSDALATAAAESMRPASFGIWLASSRMTVRPAERAGR
jgi:hypothetical protein